MNIGYEDTSRNQPKWPFIIIMIILLIFSIKAFFCVNQKDLLRFEPPLWPTPHV